jgi:hypothetical protein
VDDLIRLRTLLKSRGYFHVEFEESTPIEPINSDDNYYVRKRLREKIKNSDIVLGIAGVYATHSEWIRWEMQTALENEIPIVGVIPRGQLKISTVVEAYSINTVCWNTESIVEAIRKYALK